MLIHELSFLSPNPTQVGWDELYDTTSTTNYIYYGLAPLGSSQSAPVWWVIVYKTSPQAARYYPSNQIWANRTGLSLP